MMSKKDFKIPNMDELLAAVASTHDSLRAKLEDEEYDTMEDASFSAMTVDNINIKEHPKAVLDAWEQYKKLQPDVAKLGILGIEAVCKKGRVLATVSLTKDALETDRRVLEAITPYMPKGEDGQQVSTVPAPYFCHSPCDTQWRYARGTSSVKLVALVALTSCYIKIIPHSSGKREEWRDRTIGGKTDPRFVPTDNLLSADMCNALNMSKYINNQMVAGDVLVISAGMPFCITPAAENAEYVVKLVSFEVLSKGHKRRTAWTKTVREGMGASTLFEGGDFYIKSFSKQEPPTADTWLCKPAAAQEITWLTGVDEKSLKKEEERKKKEAMKKSEDDEKKDEDSSDADEEKKNKKDEEEEEAKKKKKKDEKKKKKKEQKRKDDEEKKKKKKEDESDEEEKKKEDESEKEKEKKKDSSEEETKPKGKKLIDRYTEYKGRLAKLDQLSWNPNILAVCDKYAIIKSMSSKESTAFGKALETLGKNVSKAEEQHAKVLPSVLKNMAEVKSMLEELEDVLTKGDGFNDVARSRDSVKAKYEKMANVEHDLVNNATLIATWVQTLNGVKEKCKQKMEKKSVGKKRHRSTPGVVPPSSSSPELPDVEVPVVNDDEVEPQLIEGRAACVAQRKIVFDVYKKFYEIGETSENNSLKMLINKLLNILKKELEPQFQPPDQQDIVIDFGKALAYASALNTYYEQTKMAKAVAQQQPTIAKPKRVKCSSCEKMCVNFKNSGMCGRCFASDDSLQQVIEGYMLRAAKLKKVADEECKNRKGKGRPTDNEMNAMEYGNMVDRMQEIVDTMSEGNGSKQNQLFAELKELQTKADELCAPSKRGYEGSDIEDDDDEESSSLSDESSSSEDESYVDRKKRREQKKVKRNAVLSDTFKKISLPSEEDDEEILDDDNDDKEKSLAHQTLMAIARIPVADIRDEMIELYQSDRTLVPNRIKKLNETTAVYGVQLTIGGGKTMDGTYYMKFEDASKAADRLRSDQVEATVRIKELKRCRDDEVEEEEENQKKSKKEEESE